VLLVDHGVTRSVLVGVIFVSSLHSVTSVTVKELLVFVVTMTLLFLEQLVQRWQTSIVILSMFHSLLEHLVLGVQPLTKVVLSVVQVTGLVVAMVTHYSLAVVDSLVELKDLSVGVALVKVD
jgi:hypothetical protein